MAGDSRKTVVVIGNGMVGHRFCEALVRADGAGRYRIVTFCEEPRAAYDRVGLTQFFAHRDPERLMLANLDWYREHGIEIHVGDRAEAIDRDGQTVRSERGVVIGWDHVVLATGSVPFVPPVPGVEKLGVFLYRTIDDLERIIAYGARCRRAAVIGGGLLGLEAAKAAHDLGLETHVIEFAPRLMPRQIDDAGSRLLVRRIENLGVHVHLATATRAVLGNGAVSGLAFDGDQTLDVEMVIVSAGIRPRDDLARDCGLRIGDRGGIVVDDRLRGRRIPGSSPSARRPCTRTWSTDSSLRDTRWRRSWPRTSRAVSAGSPAATSRRSSSSWASTSRASVRAMRAPTGRSGCATRIPSGASTESSSSRSTVRGCSAGCSSGTRRTTRC
jgi:nitrite reductase (NADH) large subunit